MKQQHRKGLEKAVELACGNLACFATRMHRRFEIAPLHRLLIDADKTAMVSSGHKMRSVFDRFVAKDDLARPVDKGFDHLAARPPEHRPPWCRSSRRPREDAFEDRYETVTLCTVRQRPAVGQIGEIRRIFKHLVGRE